MVHKNMTCIKKKVLTIRLTFLVVSMAGWVVFIAGFGKLLITIKKLRENDDPDNDGLTVDPSVVTTFLGPMWMFAVTSVFLYTTYAVNVFMSNTNMGHIFTCLTTFFNFFYTTGGVLTLAIGVLYELKSTHPLLVTVLPDTASMMLIIVGVAVSIKAFWVGQVVWPILNIKRQRRMEYTELVQN